MAIRVCDRRHVIILVLVVLVLLLAIRPDTQRPPDFLNVAPADLSRRAFKEDLVGTVVRVPFALPLTKTDCPFWWEYHPGYPPSLVWPTIRVEFKELPEIGDGRVVVEGVVSRVEMDGRPRVGRQMGVVVISSARVVRPARP